MLFGHILGFGTTWFIFDTALFISQNISENSCSQILNLKLLILFIYIITQLFYK